jgi:periplasmic divalent cation tolerance protein
MSVRLVLCTAPDSPATRQLVRTLVEERLVACGNIVSGVTSLYRWLGEVEQASEALIIFKTTVQAWPRLKERIVELHPYEVPELLLVNVEDGTAPYLEWVSRSTQPVSGS